MSTIVRFPVVSTREYHLDIPVDQAEELFMTMTPDGWVEKFGEGKLVANSPADERYISHWGEEDYATVEDEISGTVCVDTRTQAPAGFTLWEIGHESRWIASPLTAGKKWDAIGIVIPQDGDEYRVPGLTPMNGDIVEYGASSAVVVSLWRPNEGVKIPERSKSTIVMEVRRIKDRLVGWPISHYDSRIKPHQDSVAIVLVKQDDMFLGLPEGCEQGFNVPGADGNDYIVVKKIASYE